MVEPESGIQAVTVDQLGFDPQNPRLPSSVDGSDPAEVLRWMLRRQNIVELMISIGEHDYFSGEPLLAVKGPPGDDQFRIVEGNRRLAAVKLLNHPELAEVRSRGVAEAASAARFKPQVLPIIVFETRDEIIEYLGYRHITGIKNWDALAKARYLKQLFEREPEQDAHEKCRALARTIASRADYVRKLLVGLEIYRDIEDKDFFGIGGLSEESIDFSVLTTALSYSKIAAFLEVGDQLYPDIHPDAGRLKELTSWLFEKDREGTTRIGESRNLRYLSEVLADKDALARFRAGEPLAQAMMLTQVPTEVFRTSILSAKRQLQLAQKYFHSVRTVDDADQRVLEDIKNMIGDLITLARERSTVSLEE